MFKSLQDNLPISKDGTINYYGSLRRRLQSDETEVIPIQESDFIIMERDVPPQKNVGGVEEQVKGAVSAAG